MKGSSVVLSVAVALVVGVGIGHGTRSSTGEHPVITEGIIWTIEYVDGEGESRGLTRSSIPEAVPGRSGSWNMDMYGKLYPTHLEITLPKSKDLGPMVIPMDRIVQVQFGHGGIREVGTD